MLLDSEKIDWADPDQRIPQALEDRMIEHEAELYDASEREGDDLRNEQGILQMDTSPPENAPLVDLKATIAANDGENV